MHALTLQPQAAALGSRAPPCSAPWPRTAHLLLSRGGPQGAHATCRRSLRSTATPAAQLEPGMAALLAATGLDASKLAVAPSPRGLVTRKTVNIGEQLFAVPEVAWITAQTARESLEIGSYLTGLEPWLAIALFLIHERSKGGASRWGAYLASLPADSGSPVQWSEAELTELQGSQLLGTVLGYKAYFQQRFEQLQADLLGPNSTAFDSAVFTSDAFLWAACTVRARSHPPLDGANIALVPLADMTQHQRGSTSAGWKLRLVGGLFGAGAAPCLILDASSSMVAGELVAMDFGAEKSDGQVLVDHGVLDPLVNQPSYTLTLELSQEDRNFDDKADILELNKLSESMEHILRADQAPDPRLLPLLRLLNLSGTDAFLLESIFRGEVWQHMQLPVSEENERCCYQQLMDGCSTALGAYPTSIDEDLALLNSGSLEPGSRRQRAVRVRLGEKEALDATLRFFEDRIGRLENMEYYAERRLKRLGLLDDYGSSTWDGFFEDGIA